MPDAKLYAYVTVQTIVGGHDLEARCALHPELLERGEINNALRQAYRDARDTINRTVWGMALPALGWREGVE